MAINTNVAPYFDDFERKKNYLKVLFGAGRPVQARELNTMQTIIGNQLGVFADHIFKNGSRVSNGSVSIIKYEYVRLASHRTNTEETDVSKVLNTMKLVGESSGVEAKLVHKENATADSPNTLYVVYTKTGNDAQQTRFVPGETIACQDEAGNKLYDVNVKCPTCPGAPDPQDKIAPAGYAGIFLNVAAGIFYWNGQFVDVPSGMILYSRYGEDVTCKIGFDVVEKIITAEDDETLYDNALGYPNETAPGADRLSVNFVLTKRTDKIADGSKFIELATIENGYVQTIKSDYEYSGIMDTMAKRTFEESGNYTVNAWKPVYREHKKEFKDDPNGFIFGPEGKEELVNCLLSPGIGYVKGYRVETPFETFINIPKARTTASINNGSVFFAEGCYIDLIPDETLSVWPNDPAASSTVTLAEVQLYDGEPNSNAPTGQVIGSLRIADATYIGENKDHKKVWRYKVIDSKLSQPASKVKCVSSETNRFLAVPASETGFTLVNQSMKTMFWPLPKNNVKSLRDSDNHDRGSIKIAMRKKLTATLDASGNYQFTLSGATFDSNIKDTIIVVGSAGNYVSVYATADNCIPAGNTLDIKLGASESGKLVSVIHTVTTIDLIEKRKQSQTEVKVGIKRIDTDHFKHVIKLGKADVYKLEYVRAYNSASPAVYEDVTALFNLNTGVIPFAYGESSVQKKEGEVISNAFDMIDIKFRYFGHSDPNSAGYFTIDSYDAVLGDEDSGVTYKNLPRYVDSAGNQYTADQIIDFRTVMVGGQGGEVPATKSTAIFDMTYYVGRMDLLSVDSDGKFFHVYGTPADSPKVPIVRQDDIMPLYKVFVPAYTYSAKDIKVTKIENKRYTMRDIGRLEKRIENLEYYTTLSLLESKAAASNVKDKNGLDRYKNGFVVDDFSKYSTGDTSNNEFRGINDTDKFEFRPFSVLNNRKAVFDPKASTNMFVTAGRVAYLPFKHELVDEQPFASRSLSINPYLVYRKAGNLVLTPNVDSWSDTERLPDYQMNIDTGVDAVRKLAERTNSIVTAFNNHVAANSTIQTNGTVDTGLGTINRQVTNQRTSTTTSTAQTSTGTTTTTTTTTSGSVVDRRTERHASIESQTKTYGFDRVTDVKTIPYMRARNIEFVASGLAPNTRFWVFFDGQDVTNLTSAQGSTNKVSTMLQAGMLLSDKKGVLSGVIAIPAGRFFNGAKTVRVTNDPANTGNEANETSYAEAQFFSGGINQQKQMTNLNVATPVYNERDVTTQSSRSFSNTSSSTSTTRILSRIGGGRGGGRDPVAQSFKLDKDCFITKLDVYFEVVAEGDTPWFEIRTMDNGYPTATVLGRVEKKGSTIRTSLDGTVKTEVEFPVPVRVQAGTEYCFVIGGDSPHTRIWIAKLGEKAVNVPNKVCDTQVSLGSSFRSQNGTTWNAEQYEDIMYQMYCAKFEKKEATITFNVSGGVDETELDKVPFEAEKGSNLVRVYTKKPHGLVEGDKVPVMLYPDAKYVVELTNGSLVVGHELTIDGTKKAVVTSINYIDASHAEITLGAFEGNCAVGSLFHATPFVKKPESKSVLQAFYDVEVEDYDVRQAAGKFTKVVTATALNGFDVDALNRTHQVKRVDDSTSFIIEMNTQATDSGRFGPSGARCIANFKADMFNFAGSWLPHGSTVEWNFKAVAHGELGSEFERTNYNGLDPAQFTPSADRFLARPIKIATVINENEKLGSKPSFIATATFKTDSEYLSPAISVDTFSGTFIGNDISWLDKTTMDRVPNAVGRFTAETHKSQGSERFKYVTKRVNLANPAADLRIWFDMFKPQGSDFDIYVKLAKPEVDNIDDLDWTLVPNVDKTLTSANINQYVEYDLMLSDLLPDATGLDNLFGSFKVKLVARCRNSAIPPLFRNLRLIAHT